MRAVCTIGPTSWTLTMSAPAAIALQTTAAVPQSRALARGSFASDLEHLNTLP